MGAATKARSIEANDPSVLFLIARIYMDQQDWSHGAETLNEVLRDHPDLPGIHEALGTCYFMRDEFDLAATQYSDELAIDPTNGKANSMIGILFTQRGNYQAAIPYFEAALNQNPNITTLQLQLSRALWSAGNIPEAVIHAEAAERLDQKSVDAHYLLLRLYRKLGRTADAKRELAIFQNLNRK
jgi:tetratricopeptide (TPR) repeat protein